MGDLVLTNEEVVAGSRDEVFDLMATPHGSGWLFGAECDHLRVGAVVRLELPASLAPEEAGLVGTGRVIAVKRPQQVLIEQHAPWPARLTCTLADVRSADSRPRCRVRLDAELPERAIHWLLRRRGVALPPEARPDQQPIGLLVTQSGRASMLAGATEKLARLAIEEINADGPPLGRPLRLVIGDEGTSPALSALEARRLVDAEGCPVVIAGVTCPAFAAASAILRNRPALLIFSAANEGGPTGDRLIRLGERPDAQLAGAVPQVMSAADGRRWFLAGVDVSWPRAANAWARTILERAGGIVVGERLTSPRGSDPAPLIEEIERSGADCVLSTHYGADAAAFERAFYAAGLRERCRTLAPALDEATLEHIGAAAGAGIWAVSGYFEQLPTPENRAFLRRYRKRFGPFAPPPSTFSESVYETVHMVAAAARRARSWHPTDVGRAMSASRLYGPRGAVAVIGPDGLRQELYLAEATGDKYAVRGAVDRQVATR